MQTWSEVHFWAVKVKPLCASDTQQSHNPDNVTHTVLEFNWVSVLLEFVVIFNIENTVLSSIKCCLLSVCHIYNIT